MKRNLPRLLIGGVHSGCGKTTMTNAILQAFISCNLHTTAYKCGPDYIDPMFHTKILGIPSRNLDAYLCGDEMVKYLLLHHAKASDIAVIEGVMGYYDGVGGTTVQASASDLAVKTDTPSVLVLPIKGMSLSAAAIVRGFCEFAPNTIQGVLLNGISEKMYAYYRDIIEHHTGIPVYGYLPQIEQASIPSRHLGLFTASEIADLKTRMERLGKIAQQCIDLHGLQTLAQQAPALVCEPPAISKQASVRIAIAQDEAFCFYYADNLDLLTEMGVQWIPFSPLRGDALPHDIDGVYFGGGYPELYGQALQENRSMRKSVYHAIQNGLPTFAECGGFLYLHQALTDAQGSRWEMAGVIPQEATMGTHLRNFGYIELTALKDTLLCRAGESIRAHEFHYAQAAQDGQAFIAKKPLKNTERSCIYASKNLFAGFPHLHFYANTAFAATFVRHCGDYQRRKKS